MQKIKNKVMWGEIEPQIEVQTGSLEITDIPTTYDRKPPESGCKPNSYGNTKELPQPTPPYPQGLSSSVNDMVEAVAVSGSPVKSQQIGEAELTLAQRREELLQQFRSKPLVFLERYQAHLKPQHLAAFSHVSSDPRAQHYCQVIQRRAIGRTDRTRVRNQRYAALRALQREGQYFSEEQMRIREPLLYEQYIGQYLKDEEILERTLEAMQGETQGELGCSGNGTGLSHILVSSYQERLIQNRLEEEQEREKAAQEENEDDEDDDDGEKEEWEPNQEEKVMLREEFISQMHQRFLDGKDKDFNYSEVDENPDYDNLDIVDRDAEEKYFDDDDGEEEEDDNDVLDEERDNEEDEEMME
ncbi:coiled-coil domain-containing protein 97 [Lampris incognitus]|uniref:coiled-coil domain-containing protein 97 n=1 Tax=Lampris incognitus TaxID=2546036 RepID=UPI0024B53347|nr:coiled-coil domain-containing protein 97 [Lampris incognitus]